MGFRRVQPVLRHSGQVSRRLGAPISSACRCSCSGLLGLALATAWIVLTRTRYGRRLHAIGDNPRAAHLVGLPLTRDRIVTFAAAGCLSAFAGLLLAARLASVQHTMGDGLLLPAYAAVFVGTTASRTGTPNIGGTFLGVAIAGVIVNGLTILGAEPFVQRMVTGLIIIAAVLVRRFGKRAAA